MADEKNETHRLEKFNKKIKETIKNFFSEKHEFDPEFLEFECFGTQLGFSLIIKTEILFNDDPLIQEDAHRREVTRTANDEGRDLAWGFCMGGICPEAAYEASFPVKGGTVTAGFDASATIGYSVLAPYSIKPASLREYLKNMTVRLPYDARAAMDLKTGSEVIIVGNGQIEAKAGIGVGAKLSKWFDFGASGNLGVSAQKKLSLAVKRLFKNEVSVTLCERGTLCNRLTFNLGINLKDNVSEELRKMLRGEQDADGEKLEEEIRDWLSTDFMDLFEKQSRKLLAAELKLVHTITKSDRQIMSYRLDLDQAEARKAYEDIIRLNFTSADELVAGNNDAVGKAELDEQIRSEKDALALNFGKITLLSWASGSTEQEGELEVSDGLFRYHRSQLTDGYEDITLLSGDRNLTRTLIYTQDPQSNEEYHYNLKFTVKNDRTSRRNMERFLKIVKILGVLEKYDSIGLDLEGKLLKLSGKTDRIINVCIRHEGLGKLVEQSEDDIFMAYAKAYELIDAPDKSADCAYDLAPWADKNYPGYDQLMEILTARDRKGNDIRRYRDMAKRPVRDDAYAYGQAKYWAKIINKMKGIADPAERIREFSDESWALGLNFWKEFVMMVETAGLDNVLVKELSVKPEKGKKIVLMEDASVKDPYNELMAMVRVGNR